MIPTPASRKTFLRRSRAYEASSEISEDTAFPLSAVKRSAISKRSLCSAGAMMCEGGSLANWMMNSPRSVSTTSAPASISASLRWISSEAMDFPLATIAPGAPSLRARIDPTAATASSALRAQWTRPPAAVRFCDQRSRSVPSREIEDSLMAAAASLICLKLASSATAVLRFSPRTSVL